MPWWDRPWGSGSWERGWWTAQPPREEGVGLGGGAPSGRGGRGGGGKGGGGKGGGAPYPLAVSALPMSADVPEGEFVAVRWPYSVLQYPPLGQAGSFNELKARVFAAGCLVKLRDRRGKTKRRPGRAALPYQLTLKGPDASTVFVAFYTATEEEAGLDLGLVPLESRINLDVVGLGFVPGGRGAEGVSVADITGTGPAAQTVTAAQARVEADAGSEGEEEEPDWNAPSEDEVELEAEPESPRSASCEARRFVCSFTVLHISDSDPVNPTHFPQSRFPIS